MLEESKKETMMNVNTKKCPHCGAELAIDERWRGYKVECPYCSKSFVFSTTAAATENASTQRLTMTVPETKNASTVQHIKAAPKQYKVLTQKDKWYSGKFDPEKLEEAINAYAKQDWRVIGCACNFRLRAA